MANKYKLTFSQKFGKNLYKKEYTRLDKRKQAVLYKLDNNNYNVSLFIGKNPVSSKKWNFNKLSSALNKIKSILN